MSLPKKPLSASQLQAREDQIVFLSHAPPGGMARLGPDWGELVVVVPGF